MANHLLQPQREKRENEFRSEMLISKSRNKFFTSTMQSTPATTVLLTQISDGADYLSLVSDDDFDAVLKLNILFFDRLALGSPDLLGNRRLFKYLSDEPDSFEKLIGGGDNSILAATLWHQNHDLTDVAKRMVDANTIHSLGSGDDLVKHAQILDSFAPGYFRVDEADYRLRYFDQLRSLLKKHDSIADPRLITSMPSETASNKVIQWLEDLGDYSRFNCSSFYRFIEIQPFGKDEARLKLIGDTVAHYALSSSLDCRISVPSQANPFINILRSHSPLSVEEADIQETTVDTMFRADALRVLSLGDVLKLREIGPISRLRNQLANFRQGSDTNVDKIADALTECASQLLDYAYKSRSARSHFLRLTDKKLNTIRIRSVFNIASYTAPIAIAFFSGGHPNMALLSIVQTAMYGLKTIYDRSIDHVQSGSMTHSAVAKLKTGSEIIYEAREGGLTAQ